MTFEPVEVAVSVTFPLRLRLLRGDRKDLGLLVHDDELAETFHLAVLDDSGIAIGVATASPSEPDFEAPPPSWRIRQMAVDPAMQGKGVGTALFVSVLDQLGQRRAATLWAEARTTSLGFYLAQGMSVVPDRTHTTGSVAYTDVVLALR